MLIKVSTPWSHIDFNCRVNKADANIRFDFAETNTECDFWIIWGGLKTATETANCAPENIIYLTDEVHAERFYNQQFLNQFAAVLTCRTDLNHKNIIATHELNTWMIDRNYDFVTNNKIIPKSKNISVVCSDQTWLPGHKLRYAFVNKLIGHFKDRLDVFGKGFNPIKDKYDALAPYKYSIAIENSVIPGYFTEKITDCFLTQTMPVYYGCPNLEKYFDSSSFLSIDINDFKLSVSKIEQLLQEDPYEILLPILQQQQQHYLQQYHIFNKLPQLLSSQFKAGKKKQQIKIKSETLFQRGFAINKFLSRILHKMPLSEKNRFQINFYQDDLYSNKKG